nr:MAG TPA: hypothetical protein [Crassvirales sp.]
MRFEALIRDFQHAKQNFTCSFCWFVRIFRSLFFIINKTTNKCNKKARAIITTTLAHDNT